MKITSKKRRTKAEILQQKAEEIAREQAVAAKMQQFDSLEQEIQAARDEAAHNKGAAYTIQKLLDDGILIVDDEGNFVPA